MRLLLTGENLLHVEQHDHALSGIHFADSGNEMLIDSGPDRLRRRGDVLRGEIQHLTDGIHHQAGFDAAEIHDDDARAVVGRFDLQIEALPCVQHRDYFPAQIRDALDELRGLGHFGDLGEAVDLLYLRNRDTVFLCAEHERDELNFTQFLRTRGGSVSFPDLLGFNIIVSRALDVPQLLVLHQVGNVQAHYQPGAVVQFGDTRQFHPATRCNTRWRLHQTLRHVQHLVTVISPQAEHKALGIHDDDALILLDILSDLLLKLAQGGDRLPAPEES